MKKIKKNKNKINNLILIGLFFMCSCNQEQKFEKASNAIDCVRKFVGASLKSNILEAQNYILKDSLNMILLEKWYDKYSHHSKEEQKLYKESNIIILKDSVVNDSINIISYYNSFKKIPIKIKIVNQNQSYLVDLKHTFYGED